MRSAFVIVLMLLGVVRSQGQSSSGYGTQVPIFNNKPDSLAYAELDAKLNAIFRKAANDGNYNGIDSLFAARRAFLDTHPFVLRTVYRQDPTFTPYQLLAKIVNKDSITKISILGKGRRKLPDSLYMYKNLAELELIDFRLSRVPKKLAKRSSMKRLVINNNFPSRKLRLPKSSSITFLSIRGDEHGKLPKSYSKLRNLQVLQLSRNNLAEFPDLSGCDKLKRLDLNFNALTRVSSSVSGCPNLTSLNLNNNKIDRVEPGIEKLKSLEELSLYKNDLKELPPVFYSMTSLRVVDLYYNHIPKVTADIANLKKLEILYLANNDIYSLPEQIGELINLRELYLHHNKLSNLPPSVGNLISLNVLRINNNNMIEWPQGLQNLKALTNLDCSSNQFESLPISELDFRNMKILSIGGNPWDSKLKNNISLWAHSLRENNTVVHE